MPRHTIVGKLPSTNDGVRELFYEEMRLHWNRQHDPKDCLKVTGIVGNEIRYIDLEIAEHEAKVAKLKERKSQKETSLRSRQTNKNRALEARLRAIEILKGIPESKRRTWLQSRIDVLTECDFKSVDEALTFLQNQVR